MASSEKVKLYVACWLQLGKKLVMNNGQEVLLTHPIIDRDRYSAEFEAYWQTVLDQEGKNCYLEGTEQTIKDLFSSHWDIFACARCNMPTPKLELGVQAPGCPCVDLPLWPNLELPLPRGPIKSNHHLDTIRKRLVLKSEIN